MNSHVEESRNAFAAAERYMPHVSSVMYLTEGRDYALDIIENPSFRRSEKMVAQNLINTYRNRLIEKCSDIIDDNGSYEIECYWQWIELINVLENIGDKEDQELSQLKIGLLTKAFKTLSKDERSSLLSKLSK